MIANFSINAVDVLIGLGIVATIVIIVHFLR